MRILVTGSRNWNASAVIYQALMKVSDTVAIDEQITVVHGGAGGADETAGIVASGMGWIVETHPAEWKQFGNRAGYVRNAEMVAAGADICLAFIKDKSRGATMCAELAEKAGIKTRRYEA